MNLTLSIDESLIQRARKVAESMGTSVNQLIRDYLEELTAQSSLEGEILELEQLSEQARGRSRGWRFDRAELYESL